MKEYIEKQALINELASTTPFGYVSSVLGKVTFNVISKMPTADVVEVVRCKDCIYYNSNSCFNRQWDLESSTEIPMVREDDFCSYGERKERE